MFHFMLILLKMEHALITADLLNQNPKKKVMLLHKESQSPTIGKDSVILPTRFVCGSNSCQLHVSGIF